MKNNLSTETSPYLLQHANNPVFWQPWGNDAFDKAKELDRPIFLSIGYAACHWCHVMEKESFENKDIADFLNEFFISIKVDREENPEVDQIYMAAVTALTGQGGWPMSMFLTPEGQPFFGGTYFPPVPRHGLPSFSQVLFHIAEMWKEDRKKLYSNAGRITDFLKEKSKNSEEGGDAELTDNLINLINQKLVTHIDERFTGWGAAPKFPQPMALTYLLNQDKKETNQIVFQNLEMLSRGGIYDVVGGGFHRYSVDAQWRVPHFEKMLTDNALLSRVYLQANKISGNLVYKKICEDTLNFILRELMDPDGGFYSSIDADSENREGAFYTWSYTQLIKEISDTKEREIFFNSYGISPEGNFEGSHVLQRIASLENLADHYQIGIQDYQNILDRIHEKLFLARSSRPRPATDKKILVSWNALTIQAFAEAGRYLQNEVYTKTARKAAEFILKNLFINDELYRSWSMGKVKNHAYLEDYASLINALLSLYQTEFDPIWFIQARKLTTSMLSKFGNKNFDFLDVSTAHKNLIFEPQNLYDNAIPSGSSQAFKVLLQMSLYDEHNEYDKWIENIYKKMRPKVLEYPLGYANWLQGIQFFLTPVKQIALVWSSENEEPVEFLNTLWKSFQANILAAAAPYPLQNQNEQPSLLQNRQPIKNEPTVYICQGFVCQKPIQDLEKLSKFL